MPELHLVAGPNGSGKSSFVQSVRDGERALPYAMPRIINPDELAKSINPHDVNAAAIPAAREALEIRQLALRTGQSFAIETTLSGNSEQRLIADARERGYRVTMTYIALRHVADNVYRVHKRTQIEGRIVPENDVRRRYERSLTNLGKIADTLDRLDVYENSGETFAHLMTLERGRIIKSELALPEWVETAFAVQLSRDRERGIK